MHIKTKLKSQDVQTNASEDCPLWKLLLSLMWLWADVFLLFWVRVTCRTLEITNRKGESDLGGARGLHGGTEGLR